MNIECTYNGESVHMVKVEPNQVSGYVNIIYVDSVDRLKLKTVAYSSVIATGSTINESDFKNNLVGTRAPSADDDSSEGYSAGSLWFDLAASPDEIYRCVVATVAAAVWLNTSLEVGDLGSMAIQNANAVDIEGGNIDATTIGDTTPAVGSFTSMGDGTNYTISWSTSASSIDFTF